MDRVYLLQHERPDTEDVKTVGIYSSRADARAAVQRVLQQPGFCDYPGGFSIDAYELNKDHWAEGFVDL
jgi:homoserine kinase type II